MPYHFRRVLLLSIPEIPTLAGGLACLFVSSASTLAMPAFFGQIVTVISNATTPAEVTTARAEIFVIVEYLLIIFGIGGVFSFLRGPLADISCHSWAGWLFTLAGQSLVARVRKLVFNQVLMQDID